jgi:hypothetical protein
LAQRNHAGPRNAERSEKGLWILYCVLLLLIIAYALANNIIIGLAILIAVVAIVALELKASISSEGARKSVIDIGVAIGAAIAVFLALTIVLGTSAPIDAVASCSMLPNLHRGDLVVLHGISNFSDFVSSNNITVINMSASEFSRLQNGMHNEFASFFAYSPSNMSQISQIVPESSSNFKVGLYNTACLSQYSYMGDSRLYGSCFAPDQSANPIKYNYSIGSIEINGTEFKSIDTGSITINNITIRPNPKNPIMVYRTTPSDTFSGDIIHRLYAVIRTGNSYYTLTKGDNNQALDIQFANYPANSSDVIGYVVLDIPVAGYLKLILSGQIGSVPGCNTLLAQN